MTFLPIVERELRVSARRRGIYWVRTIAALVSILTFFWLCAGELLQSGPNLGGRMFNFLAWAAFVFCWLAGILFAADCLSEEKREGTLGLLFLTDLRGYDVVLGKLMATSLHSFYGLLAIFPVLALPLILGGVTLGEFWRVVLALMTTLFYSLSLGMLVSALSRRERLAHGATLLALVLFTVGLPGLGSVTAGINRPIPTPFLLLSPAHLFTLAFEKRFVGNAGVFYAAVGSLHAFAWAALALASWVLPRAWQDKPALVSKKSSWRQPGRFRRRHADCESPMPGDRCFESNPFYWLARRGQLSLNFLWTALALVAVGGIGVCLLRQGTRSQPVLGLVTLVCLHGVLKLWMASEASHRFAADRRSGALELLLGTRLSISEMLSGQRLALRRQILVPSVAVLAIDVLVGLVGRGGLFDRPALLFGVLLSMLMVDLYTLSWVGMWVGISAHHSTRAVFVAVWRILALPWVIFVGLILMTGVHWTSETELILIWLGIGILNNLFFWVSAMRGLDEDFRSLATQRHTFDPAHKRWRSLEDEARHAGPAAAVAS